MSNSTTQLELPLLQASQAQKHVTVNEALVRLDGVTQLVLASASTGTPPVAAEDGTTYSVPAAAVNAWNGQAGKLAIASNGGWVFVTPKAGWRGYVSDEGAPVTYDGASWVRGALAVSQHGAASSFRVVEFDHTLAAGATSSPVEEIPQYAMVFAVTGRVKTAITGTLTGFEVGVAGATNRYGSGIGLDQATWFVGITGQPVTYYGPTPLLISALGGDFAAGELRLALHYYLSEPSEPVMRTVMHGDVVAAARVLYACPEAERHEMIERLLLQSRRADRFRREMGRPHPFWGDGSLMSAALLSAPPPEPQHADEEYCACLAQVFEALIRRERNADTSLAWDQGQAA